MTFPKYLAAWERHPETRTRRVRVTTAGRVVGWCDHMLEVDALIARDEAPTPNWFAAGDILHDGLWRN